MCRARWRVAALLTLSALTPAGARAAGQASDDRIEITLKSGTPLRVALDQRVRVTHVGQQVIGTLTEPVYAYDRIVFPAGARVLGHVDAFEQAPRVARVQALLGGSFSSLRRVIVRFDEVVADDGARTPVQTVVTGTPARMSRQVAGGTKPASEGNEGNDEKTGILGRARREIGQRKDDAIAAIKAPGKLDRLKELAINRLPYHPQFLGKGTIYNAKLVSAVPMGTVEPAVLATDGAMPAPGSILNARLVTPIDSAKTPRGTPIEAVVAEPVFSSDRHLILAEGSVLKGEVTFSKTARHFRRNGQLRFLFESIQPPAREPRPLLASLYSVESGADSNVAVDEEGGTRVTNPKSRFVAPTLAILALSRTADPEHHRLDGDADDTAVGAAESASRGSRALGGAFGFGLIGVALSQISKPVGIAFGVVGVTRSVYSSVVARGQDVSFPADTPMQIRLAAGSTPPK